MGFEGSGCVGRGPVHLAPFRPVSSPLVVLVRDVTGLWRGRRELGKLHGNGACDVGVGMAAALPAELGCRVAISASSHANGLTVSSNFTRSQMAFGSWGECAAD